VSSSLSRNKKDIFLKVLLLAGLFVSFPGWSQQNLRGLVFEHDRYNHLPIHPAYGKFEKLPAATSNRNLFPRVVNQTLENNGVAWSVTGYGLAALYNQQNPSRKRIFSPSFTYRMCKPQEKNCADAISLVDALESLVQYGAPDGNFFGMFCVESAPQFAIDSARQTRLSGYARLFNTYDSKETKVQSIKRALINKNPVIIGLICPSSFQMAKEFWQPREKPSEDAGGHALCVVGYDDTKYGGAFEVINSWGRSWGQDGHTWLRYDDVATFVLYGFEMMLMNGEVNADFDFTTSTGEEMKVDYVKPGEYNFSRPYQTGEQFRIKIKSPRKIFSCVLAVDPSGQSGSLYPATENVIPLIENELTLPADAPFLELQGSGGKNKIIVVLSSNQLSIQQFKAQFAKDGVAGLAAFRNTGTWFKTKPGVQKAREMAILQLELVQK